LAFSYWFNKPRFHTGGRLAAVLIIPSSWGSQLGGHLPASSIFSGAVAGDLKKKLPRQLRTSIFSGAIAREKEDFYKGSLARSIFYFVIVLLYFIFACIVLSKTQKN
jgi:hypothetical protein